MIGFYNYTIILTFLGLASSVFGMTQVLEGNIALAVGCLAISGLCDAFDGKVARTKKNRTPDEIMFGIELDSLCDVICFGAFPAMICYKMGVHDYWGGVALTYYVVCAVIRLAYFNVLEVKRQQSDDPGEKVFHGLPVTSISFILPPVFLLSLVLDEKLFTIVALVMLLTVATCFILNFRVKALNIWVLIALIVLITAVVIVLLIFGKQTGSQPTVTGGYLRV